LLLEDLMRFASIYKTNGEKKLLEDLMRVASIYETYGENILLEDLMRFASIFCKTQIWRKILLGDLIIILQQIILDCL